MGILDFSRKAMEADGRAKCHERAHVVLPSGHHISQRTNGPLCRPLVHTEVTQIRHGDGRVRGKEQPRVLGNDEEPHIPAWSLGER